MTLNKTAGRSLALLAAVLLLSGIVYAQRGGGRFFGGGRFVPFQIPPNQKYDGRFTFVRVKYETAPGGYWWRGQPAWSHGYPIAEANLMKIMNERQLPGTAHRGEQHPGARRPRDCPYSLLYHRSRAGGR